MVKAVFAGIATAMIFAITATPAAIAQHLGTAPATNPAQGEKDNAPPRQVDANDQDDDLLTFEDYVQYGGPSDTFGRPAQENDGQAENRRGDWRQRFAERGAGRLRPGQRMAAMCGPLGDRIAEGMVSRIERIAKLTDAQRPAFDKFKEAAAKAYEAGKAACPSEDYASLPMRLAEIEKRLSARLASIRILRPAMEEFYAALNDEQKARLNVAGAWARAQIMGGRERRRERGERRWRGERGDRGEGWQRPWRGPS